MYFSYDGDYFETHETEQEAREAAEDAIESYRAEASDGWPDESMHVSWGRVVQCVRVTEERPSTEEDELPPGIEIFQKLELVDVVEVD